MQRLEVLLDHHATVHVHINTPGSDVGGDSATGTPTERDITCDVGKNEWATHRQVR